MYQSVGKKFLQWLFESFQTREFVGLRDDEVRSFVSVNDVVSLILSLIMKYDSNSLDLLNSKIYNVGGSKGFSRMGLAQILCINTRTELMVIEENEFNETMRNDRTKWYVYQTKNIESVIKTGIKNPRDVTMNVRETEREFNIKFTELSVVFADYLSLIDTQL